ncbi:MAG: FHIPEP family type III secretion protein [Treponema sp.]|jgi:flagellar biosynthesis protein FlhA|nr:FHIPEP family type III secretion protein [Treponema sp.]
MELGDSIHLPERIKILQPYLSTCNVLIIGADLIVVGLHYDEVNMFVPIIIIREQGLPLDLLKKAAAESGVPVLENDILAKNLFNYGKLGEVIPELCCNEVASIIVRAGVRTGRRSMPLPKTGRKANPRPVKVELDSTLMNFLEDLNLLEEGFNRISKKLSRLFGYRIPRISISVNYKLKSGEYRILFKAIEAARGRLDLSWYKTFNFGLDSRQIRLAARAASNVIVDHVDELVRRRAPELLGRDEVQAILDRAEKKYPVVTGEVKSLLSLGSIRDILRGLISEQVSIRHIPVILETLADWGNFGPVPNEIIIEQIRLSLKRQICLEYTDEKQTLWVLTLQTELEQNFSEQAVFHERGIITGVSPEEWLEAFYPAVRSMEEKGLKPVVLCAPVARSRVKEFTRMKFPNLAVLSYVEIPPDINVEAIGEISLKDLRTGS